MFFNKPEYFKMKIKKTHTMVVFLFIIFVFLILKNGYSQTNKINYASLSYADIHIGGTEPLTWNILEKLIEKDDELAKTSVSVGKKEIIYYENRYTILPYSTLLECQKKKGLWNEKNSICKTVKLKRRSDKEAVLGLKLLNTDTGEISVIKVNTKINTSGVSVVAPDGYQIEIVERPNGIKWNFWNTEYRVISPTNTIVIKNNFPREVIEAVSSIVKGKVIKRSKKVAKGLLYFNYSDFFEQSGQGEIQGEILVKAGKSRAKNVVAKAFDTLRERGVKSRSFPDRLVADVEALSPKFFERLPLLEQGDFTEFRLSPNKTVRRTLMILGANGEDAWKYTCNSSDACGWVQFTPKTYSSIRKLNPEAFLEKDFKAGAGDHVNSIMATILLADYNLSGLLKRGNKIVTDKVLADPVLTEEFIDSSHNGNPKWAHNSLTAAISRGLSDWAIALSPTRKDSLGGLRKETRDFMTKLRYLVANDLP